MQENGGHLVLLMNDFIQSRAETMLAWAIQRLKKGRMKCNKCFKCMNKFFFLFFSLSLIASVMTAILGCSSSDDFSDDTNGNVEINFTLRDEQGNVKTTFKEGENIVFDLEIANNDTRDMVYYRYFKDGSDYILNSDFLCVYDMSGVSVGYPWDNMFCDDSGYMKWIIPANTKYHIRVAWYSSSLVDMSYPLCRIEDQNVLLKEGRYYTKFTVKYKPNLDKNVLINKEFNYNFEVE